MAQLAGCDSHPQETGEVVWVGEGWHQEVKTVCSGNAGVTARYQEAEKRWGPVTGALEWPGGGVGVTRVRTGSRVAGEGTSRTHGTLGRALAWEPEPRVLATALPVTLGG